MIISSASYVGRYRYIDILPESLVLISDNDIDNHTFVVFAFMS